MEQSPSRIITKCVDGATSDSNITPQPVDNSANKMNSLRSTLKLNTELGTRFNKHKHPIISEYCEPPSLSEVARKPDPFTPQPPSDPTNVLKKKLKMKMEAQIESQVAQMPPSTPYSLISDNIEVSMLLSHVR